ncbi:MAG: XRE family transcriptional regulator [Flavobacteriales bacterium]|nr:MAG: XRE family transcriptional regulator [Flavobacteriales bacterium]
MHDIIQVIRDIQKKSGLANGAFADILEISPATLTHLYNGRNKPSLHLIEQLIKHFDVTADELISGKKRSVLNVQPKIESAPASYPLIENQPVESDSSPKVSTPSVSKKHITSVITTYSDGTFHVYVPSEN